MQHEESGDSAMPAVSTVGAEPVQVRSKLAACLQKLPPVRVSRLNPEVLDEEPDHLLQGHPVSREVCLVDRKLGGLLSG